MLLALRGAASLLFALLRHLARIGDQRVATYMSEMGVGTEEKVDTLRVDGKRAQPPRHFITREIIEGADPGKKPLFPIALCPIIGLQHPLHRAVEHRPSLGMLDQIAGGRHRDHAVFQPTSAPNGVVR
ncbi:MAG: hypothetical protein WC816_15750 [Sphingomonas sp.]|jgi:hypothetical protein